MVVSINNWYTAGGKLSEIQETCKAFQRGDQPEKIDHLTTEEIKELYATAAAIVSFCAASFEVRTASKLQFRDHETYQYARSYARALARALLRREDITIEDVVELQQWLDRDPALPPFPVTFV